MWPSLKRDVSGNEEKALTEEVERAVMSEWIRALRRRRRVSRSPLPLTRSHIFGDANPPASIGHAFLDLGADVQVEVDLVRVHRLSVTRERHSR